jgi:MYXO-CTERM domain-containing protein
MNSPNEDGKQPEKKMESVKEGTACCGPGCGCGTAAKPNKARWVVGVIVLAAAGVLVVKGMIKSDKGWTQAATAGFANPAATQAAAGADTKSDAAAADEATVGTTLGAFAELNTAAAKTDAVFVFLPAREGAAAKAPSAPMKAAVRTMEAKGVKCGLFTLKPGTRDYDQVAKQTPVPGVLALVKGRGMSAVSGEVTEAKLLQGYVAASRSGGCGPSAGAGCCPK